MLSCDQSLWRQNCDAAVALRLSAQRDIGEVQPQQCNPLQHDHAEARTSHGGLRRCTRRLPVPVTLTARLRCACSDGRGTPAVLRRRSRLAPDGRMAQA